MIEGGMLKINTAAQTIRPYEIYDLVKSTDPVLKQICKPFDFANPPIDPIREEMVMSLRCPVGPEQNLLDISPQHCARMVFDHPILTLEQMQAMKDTTFKGWSSHVIDCTMPVDGGVTVLLDRIFEIGKVKFDLLMY